MLVFGITRLAEEIMPNRSLEVFSLKKIIENQTNKHISKYIELILLVALFVCFVCLI